MKKQEQNAYQELAFKICDILDANKGEDILAINVGAISSVADYFILVTATSSPHTRALMEKVEEELEKTGERISRRDGASDGRWIVMDYGNIIVHIFTNELREFYHLEKLWSNGKNSFSLSDIQKFREKDAKQKIDEIKKAEKAENLAKAKADKEEKALAKKVCKAEKSVALKKTKDEEKLAKVKKTTKNEK